MFPSIRISMVMGLAVGIAITPGAAFSQQRGNQTPPSTTTPAPGPGNNTGTPGIPGGRNTPGNVPFPGQQGQTQPGAQQYPQMPRPIFLSGKVVLDDGTPPQEPVVIERVCNGRPRPEGYTDTKGRFSFQVGQNTAMMADASYDGMGSSGYGTPGIPGGRGMTAGSRNQGMGSMGDMGLGRDLSMCELRAVLPGFRSDTVNLANHRSLDDPNVGTIVLHRLGNVEGTTISATSLQAPKDAKKAYQKGKDALKKNKAEEAEKHFQKAVDLYPKYAVAWYELGVLQQKSQKPEDARKSYQQALAADSRLILPYLQLSMLAVQEKKWEEVVETTNRAVKLDPVDFPQAYFFNSVANYYLRRMDAAEKSAREAQKLDTEHRYPKINHVLGVILAEKRDYPAAVEQMRSYLKFSPDAQDAETVKKQLVELEKLSNPSAKTSEQ